VSSWPSTPDPYPPSLHDALPILATLGPRSLRLQQLDRTEGSSRVLHELRETLALKKLDEKGTSGSEDLGGEQQRLLGKAHAAGLIDRACATDIGGHIGHHKIYLLVPDGARERLDGGRIGEISVQEFDPRDRLHRQQVDRPDPPARADALRGVLAPGPRRRAEVDDAHPGP